MYGLKFRKANDDLTSYENLHYDICFYNVNQQHGGSANYSAVLRSEHSGMLRRVDR